MGHVASECAQRRSARPDGLADFRILERTLRVFWQRQPETVLVGTGGHIVDEGVVRVGDPVRRHRVVRRQQGVLAGHAGLPDGLAIPADLSVWGEIGRDAFLDRKSTRLNSSHSQISYAVFCLKKKKKKK